MKEARARQKNRTNWAQPLMPYSLHMEEESLQRLRQIADASLPYNFRLTDDEITQCSNAILRKVENFHDTKWDDYFRLFEAAIKSAHAKHCEWYDNLGTCHRICSFSAPRPGLSIHCELPQSSIVGWGFTYFLQENSSAGDNIKVGFSRRDPIGRANALLTISSGTHTLVGLINSPASFEKMLHERFSKHRLYEKREIFSSDCDWQEFCQNGFSDTELRDEIIRAALADRSLSHVFTADEYQGWLLYTKRD